MFSFEAGALYPWIMLETEIQAGLTAGLPHAFGRYECGNVLYLPSMLPRFSIGKLCHIRYPAP